MEYTKDLIFNVHYDEVHQTIGLKKNKWTSRMIEKIKQHKMMTGAVLTVIFFMMIDGILIMNFVNLLEEL